MEKRNEKNGPRNVPQFGAWDNNGGDGGYGGYTVEFSKARANKQHQPKNGLDVRHELKNDKEFQYQEPKNGLDARHELKNDMKFQHQHHKNGLDAHHGLKKHDKGIQHHQQKNDLDPHHGLKSNQEFQPHQHKNGLGAHHGFTNDQEFPGKKQEDPDSMKNGYRSVPQFGMWDQQAAGTGAASYTVEFSKARVNKKQHKNNDLLARPPSIDHEQEDVRKQHEESCMRKKNMLTYLNCCIRP